MCAAFGSTAWLSLHPRKAVSAVQVNNNAEITALKQIIGLQHAKTYTDAKALRYGKIMIMTDQDQDGSHIKGLIMNFLHHFYPSLLKVPGFLVEFITPIVKVRSSLAPEVLALSHSVTLLSRNLLHAQPACHA